MVGPGRVQADGVGHCPADRPAEVVGSRQLPAEVGGARRSLAGGRR